ncbi:MAG: enoyl-CoA hydratase/isomerase family protein [Variovorax sp.]|nr:MAG: enoyl-CoA hydratase/isomerase family protein [Variovorax sp.]
MRIDISRPEPYIALVTINNPARRNALSSAGFHGLAAAWRQLGSDPSVRCIVVTGEGSQAFCSGAQLDADFSAEPAVDDMVDAALLKTGLLGKPLVAAVNGHCVAGGFELMLACDLRVVSEQALLGLPEVRWAIVPSGGGAMKLIEQIGHARAMQLMLTAELVSAATALDFGLVNSVVPAGDVLETALAFARRIASNSPLAVYMTKQSALAGRSLGWQALEADERARVRIVRESSDVQIGRRAFLDKTLPAYPDYPDYPCSPG